MPDFKPFPDMTYAKSLRKATLLCLFLSISINLFAQKLPGKQEGSLRAPDKVKIDGKGTEWTLKAFNKATDVFYTIANDKDNLYLIVKAEYEGTIRKIISSGLTFSVNASGKKWNENTVSVTYPVLNLKTRPFINYKDKPTASGIDSFVLANNRRFNLQSKFIRTAGIQQVDTLVSVYNGDGIRAAAAFDKDMSYVYELAISLNHIKQALTPDGKLFYRVTLNAIGMDDMPGVDITRNASGAIQSITINKSAGLRNATGMNADTDFSDEYVLVK